MRLIVGLGNPGKEYEYTRHNLGFRVIDELSTLWGIKLTQNKCLSLVGQKKISPFLQTRSPRVLGKVSPGLCLEDVVLAKPLTFVNLSGAAVKCLLDWLRIGRERLLVICDDFNLEKGKIRIRKAGSSGGHKGLDSIIQCLGSPEFPRLRLGIGRPPEGIDCAEYVLGRFTREEREVVEEMVKRAAQAIETIIDAGIDYAMAKKW